MNYDLDSIQMNVHLQAISKKWKTSADYCIKRARQELDELEQAVNQNNKINVGLEVIDVLYFIVQVARAAAPEISLNNSYMKKFNDNWVNKKKTEDENGNEVLR